MKIAYLIAAHKGWSQLARLINTLKEDWNGIFLHIDVKSNFNMQEFTKLLDCKIEYVEPRVSVKWGHVSQVVATINGLRQIVTNNIEYDRIVFISGEDYPVVSNADIYNFFNENRDVQFLEFAKFPVRWWPYGGYDRVCVYNFPDILGPFLNRVLRVFQMLLPFRRKSFDKFSLYGSSTWFNITKDAAMFIVQNVDDNDLLDVFKYTYCVDEILFQTILLNSQYKTQCANNCLRYIKWNSGKSHPEYINSDDVDIIRKENMAFIKYLFARKVDEDVICRVLN